MIPRGRFGALLFLLASATAFVAAADDETVRIRELRDWRVVEASLPGRLVGYAIPAEAGRRLSIVALVREIEPDESSQTDESEDDDFDPLPRCPRTSAAEPERDWSVHRLELTGTDALVPVALELAGDYQAIEATDIDGDGIDEILLARAGGLDVVRDGGVHPLFDDSDFGWRGMHPDGARHAGGTTGARTWSIALGELRLYGPAIPAGRWKRIATADLPVEGKVTGDRLEVRGARPSFVGTEPDGTAVFATAPELFGNRIRVIRVGIASDGTTGTTDCWGRLPEPEDVLEHTFVPIDGEPHLLVTTKPANKLALFGEKRLRIFALRGDRTRLGIAPVFAGESRVNLWQGVTPMMLDVNGDGREDLVLGYWKGLKDDRVVLDAYLREEGGGFDAGPVSTAFDVKKGDRSFVGYGADLDGDGASDLLVRTEKGMQFYRGLPSANGKKLLDKKPVELPVESSGEGGDVYIEFSPGGSGMRIERDSSEPRTVDLDGDGRDEVLLVRATEDDRGGTIRVLSYRGTRK